MVSSSTIYVLIAVLVLLIIWIIMFFAKKNKKHEKLSVLASLAFILVIAGICFGDNRIVGYSLIGAGVVLAIIDISLRRR